MPSPFPGVDPYVENTGIWRDFHSRFLTHLSDHLNELLPGHYAAVIDEEFRILDDPPTPGRPRGFRPDPTVARSGRPAEPARAAGGVATLEPVTLLYPEDEEEEDRPTWVEVQRLPDREVVAVIELLSPANKDGHGRSEYLRKRKAVLGRELHLIELDLLLSGPRLPMRGVLPKGDFYAFIARAEQRPRGEAYAWTVRQALPTIPIPLREPDPDVRIDLGVAYQASYERGRYRNLLRYDAPLTDDDRTWAAERASGAVR
jgi:hypothetical protein